MSNQNIRNIFIRCIPAIFALLFIFILNGCTPPAECTDIRLQLENEGYMNGWTYVQDIKTLDDEKDSAGRVLFALYENDSNPGEYAVLHIVKLTVPNSYGCFAVEATYDSGSNTAKSLNGNKFLSLDVQYDSSGMKVQ